MKYQVARAIREGKTQNEILNLMVKKYGSKVLVDKAGLAK
jgi:cytochrome c-type biogenesis protein CcmH/NrfF